MTIEEYLRKWKWEEARATPEQKAQLKADIAKLQRAVAKQAKKP